LGVLGLLAGGGLLVSIPAWPVLVWQWLTTQWLGASVLGAAVLILLLWKLPQRQVAEVPAGHARVALEVQSRHTLVHLSVGVLIFLGLVYAVTRLQTPPAALQLSQETLQLAQEGQRAARIAQAMAHLGDTTRLTVRLGGIYALEQLARGSPADHWPIMEVLMAYLRDTVPWPPRQASPRADTSLRLETAGEGPRPFSALTPRPSRSPSTDIQAILTVLGRRVWTYEQGEMQRVNLAYTALAGAHLEGARLQSGNLTGIQLQGAYLAGAHLEHARLEGSDLAGAHLQGAYLQGAQLTGANLQGANLGTASLGVANLQGANLRGAQLQGARLPKANLLGADLRGASLWDAELWGADLRGADLRGVKDMAQHQVNVICVNEQTQLAEGLAPPVPCRPAQP
jgi:hypothetical protein